MTKNIIPIGPQHPLLKEPISVNIEVSGEDVLGGSLRIGYVHRGIERLAQERTYVQNVHLIERICGICSHVHTTTFCYAVEDLLGVEIPPRAQYIRALMCELERIHSHLLWIGILAKHIGLDMVFMHSWHNREIVLDIMEALSGGRVSHAANLIGGVRFDMDAEHESMVRRKLQKRGGPAIRCSGCDPNRSDHPSENHWCRADHGRSDPGVFCCGAGCPGFRCGCRYAAR